MCASDWILRADGRYIRWELSNLMPFDGVSFIIIGRKQLECRYGRVHGSRQRPDHSRSVSCYCCVFVLSLFYPSECYVQLFTLYFLECYLYVVGTVFYAIPKIAMVRNRLHCTTCCCCMNLITSVLTLQSSLVEILGLQFKWVYK